MVTVLNAFATPRTEAAAVRLVFEYLAATQAEAGQPEPASIDALHPVLRHEIHHLREVYRPPGGLWLAYRDNRPVGCVGLVSRAMGTAEVKRLYVRPAERGGIGRVLMDHVHEHAAREFFLRVVVNVIPARTAAIAFYRGLGYTDAEPYDMTPMSMVGLQRTIG